MKKVLLIMVFILGIIFFVLNKDNIKQMNIVKNDSTMIVNKKAENNKNNIMLKNDKETNQIVNNEEVNINQKVNTNKETFYSERDIKRQSFVNHPEFKQMKKYQDLVLPTSEDKAKKEAFFSENVNLEKMEHILTLADSNAEINEYDHVLAIEFLATGASVSNEENKDKIKQIIDNYLADYSNVTNFPNEEQRKIISSNWMDLYTVARIFFGDIAKKYEESNDERIKSLIKYSQSRLNPLQLQFNVAKN